ncbi:MAG: hypothetical protein ACFCVD_07455 [Nodosilinea sp.]
MNGKLIGFSGLVTALLGAMLGLGVAEICEYDYQSGFYRNLRAKFVIGGALIGVAVGAGQETVRELKKFQDQDLPSSTFLTRNRL